MTTVQEHRLTPSFANQPPLDPLAIYRSLRIDPTSCAEAAPFTAHVFACVIAIGLLDSIENRTCLGRAVGLNRDELAALARDWLPGALVWIDISTLPETSPFDDEEEQLRHLLQSHQADSRPEALWLTSMIARRSMSANHLWQDLGLLDRTELNRLMSERYPGLASRNVSNMKWKKFFYRMLCEMEGFSLCTAPTCHECNDFDACFGEETGDSALARMRRGNALTI
jgi:nitrogen fixation protein NifQ